MSRAADLAALIVDVNTTEAKTDELTGKTSAGSIAVTGEGGSTTTNLQQGLIKSWLNMQGTGTVAINDSFNVSSITDNSSGNYTTTFSNALNAANSMAVSGAGSDSGSAVGQRIFNGGVNTTTTTRNGFTHTPFSYSDAGLAMIKVTGDLA
jgi:hypothetical protein